MFPIKFFYILLLLTVVTSVNCSFRKIRDGKDVKGIMDFMVYLTRANKTEPKYDAWICGGSIINEYFILTSAACVQDVPFMYAIAGTNKYVKWDKIDLDACTKESKKKIVLTCVPKLYSFDYQKIDKWAFIDIALAKVETPYNFDGPVTSGCTHVPKPIEINYEVKYQLPNTDAMVLGWGHKQKWRPIADKTDYNEELLQYSSILVMDKTECKKQYNTDVTKELLPIIDKYMICAMNEGNIDSEGQLINKTTPNADGCSPGSLRVGGVCQGAQSYQQQNSQIRNQNPMPYNPNPYNPMPNNAMPQNPIPIPKNPNDPYTFFIQNPMSAPQYNYNRQQGVNLNEDSISFEDIVLNLRRNAKNETSYNYTRRAGICQNDHGGPLVTWVGKHERLIGVASVFRVASDSSCIGPYLFTSTQCNSLFIECSLHYNNWTKTLPDPPNSRRTNLNICDLPPEKKGFDIIRRRISWKTHPDGPAANELKEDLFYRPVKPLRP